MKTCKLFHQKCRKEAPTQKTKIHPEFDVMSGGGIATKIKSVSEAGRSSGASERASAHGSLAPDQTKLKGELLYTFSLPLHRSLPQDTEGRREQ